MDLLAILRTILLGGLLGGMLVIGFYIERIYEEGLTLNICVIHMETNSKIIPGDCTEWDSE